MAEGTERNKHISSILFITAEIPPMTSCALNFDYFLNIASLITVKLVNKFQCVNFRRNIHIIEPNLVIVLVLEHEV